MHKFIIKSFDFIKNCVQGISILTTFIIMLLVLNWIESLTKSHWGWLDVFRPLLDGLTNTGSLLMGGTFSVFNVSFELKYLAAVILCIILLIAVKVCENCLNILQEMYENGRSAVKKMAENKFNKDLQNIQKTEQEQQKSYYVYISIVSKKAEKFGVNTVDIDEQTKLLNKFLIEKLGTAPTVYEQGFLYKFSKIDNIDDVLEILFKVLCSDAPVNYQICMILDRSDKSLNLEMLKNLIKLNIINKICLLSKLEYRYRFIEHRKYYTSLIGVFRNENDSNEVYEFVENDTI